jgi:MFS family permease
MTDPAFAAVSAIFTVGGLAGALGAGPVCSTYGRKLAMQITAAVFLLGSIIETLSNSVPLLGAGRILNGVGAGAATVIVPLFISEIAPPKARGFFGTMTQVSVNVGICSTQAMGYFLSHGSAWRWILGAGIIIAGVHGLGLLLMTESPAWLACHKGDVLRARRILERIRGGDVNLDEEVKAWGAGAGDGADDAADEEEQALLAQSLAESTPMSPRATAAKGSRPMTVGFFHVVRDPLYRPAIVCVIGIMFAQQICGINSVILYSVSLLDGMLPFSSALLTLCVSIINLITTICAAPLPDKIGRKTCLLVSIAGQGSSSLALALSIMFGVKVLSAVAVALFVAFFALGLGPVPFMIASELVGQEAVGATQSWALGANYVATFLVAQFFPIINKALNDWLGGAGWSYFVFAFCAVGFGIFVSVYVPETKGKKDADEVWGRTRRID